MANSLTYLGERAALMADDQATGPTGPYGGQGGVTKAGQKIKLYTTASSPAKDGSGFTEVANEHGYTTGGHAIDYTDWTYTELSSVVTLDDQVWTASGGSIVDIKGAYLTDENDNILAWWERATGVTLGDGDSITLDDLDIALV